MSDIVVGVRLTADGSGLVGQARVSSAELDRLRTAQKGAADAARDLSQATGQAATAIGSSGTEARKAAFQLSDLSQKSEAQARAQRQAGEASVALDRNIGMQRAGWQQLGFQMQDVFASYSSGTRLSVIFAQQSGQMVSALALIGQSAEGSKGKLAGLASFFGGPWGIAIGVAVSVVGALASKFLDVESAADKAGAAADDFARRQADLANFIDKTTGRLAEQNKYLLQNAILLRQTKIDESRKSIAESREEAFGLATATRRRMYDPESRMAGITGETAVDRDVEAAIAQSRGNQFALADALNKLAASRPDLKPLIEKINSAAAKSIFDVRNIRQQRQEIAFLSGDRAVAPGFTPKAERAGRKSGDGADKAAREAQRLAEFSDRAAESVARINDEYNRAPRDIDRARQATVQLDSIFNDVNERLKGGAKLTEEQRAGLERIGAEAQKLKPIIADSLARPIREMIDDQERQIELTRLTLSGREAEAQALQLTWSLMDKLGVESEAQLATELAKRGVRADEIRQLYDNLAVMRQQTREMRAQQALQDAFLSAVADTRENVRQTIESLRKDGPKAIGDFFKRSMDVFDRLFADVVTEKLFGDLFRDLEEQVKGKSKTDKAGDRLAKAVEDAAKDVDKASGSIASLGDAAASAAAKLSGAAASGAGSAAGGLSIDIDSLRALANGELGGSGNGIVAGEWPDPDFGDFGDIIVNGKLPGGFKTGFESVFNDLKKGLNDVFTDIFGDKGLFGETLSTTLGKTFGNAALGGAAGSLVTGLFGVKGSGTGGMLGGAIGGALGKEFLGGLGKLAGPLGSILGGTLGSVLGGVLKSTPKASATITGGGEDDVSVTGNKDSLKKASVGLARSVQDTLDQIAEEFGGEVGKFAVSIGIRHGDYRVDTSGSGKTKKKSGAVDFDEDQAGAIAYAVMDAITDGGITGISAAVQKALKSSTELDDALEEALKVREVEKLLGGLGAEMEDAFRQFESQAKERLRIATEYGFDVLEIEKRNAEDRADLIESMMKEQVGALQNLISEMTSGSMFEGSAVEQRTAILAEIEKAKADVAAGKDGAADVLASLFERLNDVSREAYGTTGQYAADRAMILDQAQAAIEAAQVRITAAANAASSASAATTSDPALAATAAAMDENNDQNAELIALMRELVARNGGGAPPSGGFIDIRGLARTS